MTAKILAWPSTVNNKPVELLKPLGGPVKLGLYPLGVSDVVMSVSLLDLTVKMLEQGTAVERMVFAQKLRETLTVFIVEAP